MKLRVSERTPVQNQSRISNLLNVVLSYGEDLVKIAFQNFFFYKDVMSVLLLV